MNIINEIINLNLYLYEIQFPNADKNWIAKQREKIRVNNELENHRQAVEELVAKIKVLEKHSVNNWIEEYKRQVKYHQSEVERLETL